MTREADLGPRVSGRLTYLLKRSMVDLDALHEQHLEPVGVTARELTVLLFLDGREPESQQQAAARLGVDRTTMVGLLDALQDKDLVARRPDADDRRRNVIVLTDAGRKTLRRAMLASDAAERELLTELDDREATQLRELLMRIVSGRAQA